MNCRHCGQPLRDDLRFQAAPIHDHGLIRCQEPGWPYGYEAKIDDGKPCECWACKEFGRRGAR